MSIARVKRAAFCRGIYFDGVKKWLNNVVGCGYEAFTDDGFMLADTLDGMYRLIMKYPKIDMGGY